MAEKMYENVKGSDGHGLQLLFKTFCSRKNWNHYNYLGESECHPCIMEESMIIPKRKSSSHCIHMYTHKHTREDVADDKNGCCCCSAALMLTSSVGLKEMRKM